jgi:hypothetical protein
MMKIMPLTQNILNSLNNKPENFKTMKNKNLLLIISLFLTSMMVFGQAPNKIDFQAMARDASSNPIVMQTIGVRISVIEGGSTVYTERHTPQTDDYGLFNIHIGDGTPLSGNFNSIDWGLGNHSVKVEVDPSGGYVYVNMGTSQLTSTPYSLYGEDDDADPGNELQILSIVGNDLTISDGNTVTLPGGGGSSLWTQNGDDIYYDAGKVGIGIDSPVKEFHLFNGMGTGGGTYADMVDAIIEDDTYAYLEFNGEGWAGMTFNDQNESIYAGFFYNYYNERISIKSGGSDDRVVIDADGNVGINKSNPLVRFHVDESGSDGVLGTDLGISFYSTDVHAPAAFASSLNSNTSRAYGLIGLANQSGGVNVGVLGDSEGGTSSFGVAGAGYGGTSYNIGVYGADGTSASSNYAGYFYGDVYVNGTLSKGGGSFKIDHPQDPANKFLIHSFVESPDMMNIYNGNVVTDAQGIALVELPEYFDALNIEFRYQLTVIGEFAQAIVKEEISANQFTIQTDKPNVKVSWQVTGIRNDAWAQENRIEVEVDKPVHEKGLYLHPELFGKSADMGMKVTGSSNKNVPTQSPPKTEVNTPSSSGLK